MDSNQTEAEVIAQLGADAGGVHPIKVDGTHQYAITRDDDGTQKINPLEDFQTRPNRVRAFPKFRTSEALCDYLQRFGNSSTTVFLDYDHHSIEAVIDYHEGGKSPQFCSHKAQYKARMTEEWRAWAGRCGSLYGQAEFIRFLEEHAGDVVDPDSAGLMELCMRFEAIQTVDFKSSKRLSDGSRELIYSEQTQAKGSIKVPEELTLFIPVLEGQEPQEIRVFFRTRIIDSNLKFATEIHRKARVLDEAFNVITYDVKERMSGHGAFIYDGVRS